MSLLNETPNILEQEVADLSMSGYIVAVACSGSCRRLEQGCPLSELEKGGLTAVP